MLNEQFKLISNDEVDIYYTINKDHVVLAFGTVKDKPIENKEDNPLNEYYLDVFEQYVVKKDNYTLCFTPIEKNVFSISSENSINTNNLALAVWFSNEIPQDIVITDKIIVRVPDDMFADNERFSRELFDYMADDILRELKLMESKPIVNYIKLRSKALSEMTEKEINTTIKLFNRLTCEE